MDYTDIQPLLNAYHRKLAATDLRFKRYLYGQINWNVRLVGIKGARGVGKTTILLEGSLFTPLTAYPFENNSNMRAL